MSVPPEVPPAVPPASPRRTRAPRAAGPAVLSAPVPTEATDAPVTGDALAPAVAAVTKAPARKAPVKKAAPAKAAPAKAAPAKAAPEPAAPVHERGPVTLCIDVGGTGIKGAAVDASGAMVGERVKIDTTYPLKPEQLVDTIAEIARRSPAATRISIGFPGMVRTGRVLSAPHFVTKKGPGTKVVPELVKAWDRFDLSTAVDQRLSLPCRLANDADTQGLAAIEGTGLELVITLGTGIGTALFLDGELQTHLELSHHLLVNKQTYNEYVGNTAYLKLGKKAWTKRVDETVTVLKELTFFDRLYVGGGNAENLGKGFRHEATVVPNTDGITGGAKLWSLHRVP